MFVELTAIISTILGSMSPILWILLTFSNFVDAFSTHSLLRAVKSPDFPHAAFDLDNSTFDPALKETPASFALIEFFAHWCPACRNYKPQYEKVAKLFNGPNAVHPGIIFVAGVDCALKVNIQLCDRFSIRHYPMLLWGPPSKFAAGGWEPREGEKSEIISIDDGRTAEHLLNWINKQMGSSFSLEDQKYENEDIMITNFSNPGQIARALHDIEEATANAFGIILEMRMINSETRAPFIHFLQLLTAHHPSKRCRKGSAEMLTNLEDLWPSHLLSDSKNEITNIRNKDIFRSFRICGKEVPRGYWMFCRGSKNDTRGFSCGLWVLLHALSVRLDDGESHQAFTTICEFVQKFFICEECRQHFYRMCLSVSSPMNATKDFALWLWDAHNQVNKRLMKEELESGTADPKFPKVMWPTKALCSACSLMVNKTNGSLHMDWDKDEVLNFLASYYGKALVSKSGDLNNFWKESVAEEMVVSNNAVAVPVGAALAVAVASCGFAALACFWRSQQKKNKYLHQLHYVKSI